MRKELLLVTIFFCALGLILFRETVFQGKIPIAADLAVNFYEPWKSDRNPTSYKPLGFDDIRIFFPQRIFAVSQMLQGRLPLWNPYEFAGNVHLANSQTATFYPPFLLFLFFSPTAVWTLMSLSLPVLAGVFTYLFLRQFVGKTASLFGATAFALSGFMVVRLEDGLVAGHSAVYLPLVLFGLELLARGKRLTGFFLALLGLVFSLLAGWFQFSFYLIIFSFLYGLYRRIKLPTLVGIFILFIIITSPHWLPSWQSLALSPRGQASSVQLSKHAMELPHVLTLFSPDLFGHPADGTYFGKSEYKEGMVYIGIVAMLFALGVIKVRKYWFFSLSVVTTILLGLNLPFLTPLLSKIPIINTFLPNRIFFLASFSLSVLAGLGIDRWQREDQTTRGLKNTTIFVASPLLLILVAIGLIYVNEKALLPLTHFSFFQRGWERYLLLIAQSIRTTILALIFMALGLFLLSRKRITKNIFIWLAFAVSIGSQLYFANHYLYFSDRKNLFPAHPVLAFLQEQTKNDFSRFVSLGEAHFTSNVATFYGLYDVEGVDALYPAWYGKFSGYVATNGKSLLAQDRISTWYSPKIENKNDWGSPFVVNYLKLTGVRYVVLKNNFPALPPPTSFRLTFSYRDWQIYEFLQFSPKAVFVSDFRVITDDKAALDAIFDPNFDPRKEVVLQMPNAAESSKQGSGKVAILSSSPAAISFQVFASNSGFLVINNDYHPNWQAKVDGQETPVTRANFTFQAVPVPAGQHEVSLVFKYF